ncbi:hypothetical protein SNEBB_000134 [Seison nebaliae]|nr:hypothetical protein SNEBB_000134 [Seison nebaliae]
MSLMERKDAKKEVREKKLSDSFSFAAESSNITVKGIELDNGMFFQMSLIDLIRHFHITCKYSISWICISHQIARCLIPLEYLSCLSALCRFAGNHEELHNHYKSVNDNLSKYVYRNRLIRCHVMTQEEEMIPEITMKNEPKYEIVLSYIEKYDLLILLFLLKDAIQTIFDIEESESQELAFNYFSIEWIHRSMSILFETLKLIRCSFHGLIYDKNQINREIRKMNVEKEKIIVEMEDVFNYLISKIPELDSNSMKKRIYEFHSLNKPLGDIFYQFDNTLYDENAVEMIKGRLARRKAMSSAFFELDWNVILDEYFENNKNSLILKHLVPSNVGKDIGDGDDIDTVDEDDIDEDLIDELQPNSSNMSQNKEIEEDKQVSTAKIQENLVDLITTIVFDTKNGAIGFISDWEERATECVELLDKNSRISRDELGMCKLYKMNDPLEEITQRLSSANAEQLRDLRTKYVDLYNELLQASERLKCGEWIDDVYKKISNLTGSSALSHDRRSTFYGTDSDEEITVEKLPKKTEEISDKLTESLMSNLKKKKSIIPDDDDVNKEASESFRINERHRSVSFGDIDVEKDSSSKNPVELKPIIKKKSSEKKRDFDSEFIDKRKSISESPDTSNIEKKRHSAVLGQGILKSTWTPKVSNFDMETQRYTAIDVPVQTISTFMKMKFFYFILLITISEIFALTITDKLYTGLTAIGTSMLARITAKQQLLVKLMNSVNVTNNSYQIPIKNKKILELSIVNAIGKTTTEIEKVEQHYQGLKKVTKFSECYWVNKLDQVLDKVKTFQLTCEPDGKPIPLRHNYYNEDTKKIGTTELEKLNQVECASGNCVNVTIDDGKFQYITRYACINKDIQIAEYPVNLKKLQNNGVNDLNLLPILDTDVTIMHIGENIKLKFNEKDVTYNGITRTIIYDTKTLYFFALDERRASEKITGLPKPVTLPLYSKDSCFLPQDSVIFSTSKADDNYVKQQLCKDYSDCETDITDFSEVMVITLFEFKITPESSERITMQVVLDKNDRATLIILPFTFATTPTETLTCKFGATASEAAILADICVIPVTSTTVNKKSFV